MSEFDDRQFVTPPEIIDNAWAEIIEEGEDDKEYLEKLIRLTLKEPRVNIWEKLFALYLAGRMDLVDSIIELMSEEYYSVIFRKDYSDFYFLDLWNKIIQDGYFDIADRFAGIVLSKRESNYTRIIAGRCTTFNGCSGTMYYIKLLNKYHLEANPLVVFHMIRMCPRIAKEYIKQHDVIDRIVNLSVCKSLFIAYTLGNATLEEIKDFVDSFDVDTVGLGGYNFVEILESALGAGSSKVLSFYGLISYRVKNGETPDYDELITEEDVDELKMGIIARDTDTIDLYLPALLDTGVPHNAVVRYLANEIEYVLKHDDINTFKHLFPPLDFESFYINDYADAETHFTYRPPFSIMRYLLENSEITSSENVTVFWRRILSMAIVNDNIDVVDLITDYFVSDVYSDYGEIFVQADKSLNPIEVIGKYLKIFKYKAPAVFDRNMCYYMIDLALFHLRNLSQETVERVLDYLLQFFDQDCIPVDTIEINFFEFGITTSERWLEHKWFFWDRCCKELGEEMYRFLTRILIHLHVNDFTRQVGMDTGIFNNASKDFVDYFVNYCVANHVLSFEEELGEELLIDPYISNDFKDQLFLTAVEKGCVYGPTKWLQTYTPSEPVLSRVNEVLGRSS